MTDTAPRAILETILYVEDIPAAENFYGAVLGLSPFIRFGELGLGYRIGGRFLLLFDPRQSSQPGRMLPAHGSRGGGHLAFEASPAELDLWRARLEAAGVAIEQTHDWGAGLCSIYFRDPAGNLLEFTQAGIWELLAGS